ncbi:MAG: hypothetical protein F4Y35_08745 [Chloroflexi bacterium]|nr:hypothetical protein [Chloroflexota bacterium]
MQLIHSARKLARRTLKVAYHRTRSLASRGRRGVFNALAGDDIVTTVRFEAETAASENRSVGRHNAILRRLDAADVTTESIRQLLVEISERVSSLERAMESVSELSQEMATQRQLQDAVEESQRRLNAIDRRLKALVTKQEMEEVSYSLDAKVGAIGREVGALANQLEVLSNESEVPNSDNPVEMRMVGLSEGTEHLSRVLAETPSQDPRREQLVSSLNAIQKLQGRLVTPADFDEQTFVLSPSESDALTLMAEHLFAEASPSVQGAQAGSTHIHQLALGKGSRNVLLNLGQLGVSKQESIISFVPVEREDHGRKRWAKVWPWVKRSSPAAFALLFLAVRTAVGDPTAPMEALLLWIGPPS